MVFLGLGEICGTVINGNLSDRFGSKLIMILNMCEVVLAFVLLMLFNWVGEFSLWSAAIVTFTWGVQDGGVNNFLYTILGFQFESKTLPFCVYTFVQNIFCFVFICLEGLINTQLSYLIYFLASACYAIFSWLFFMKTFDIYEDLEID